MTGRAEFADISPFSPQPNYVDCYYILVCARCHYGIAFPLTKALANDPGYDIPNFAADAGQFIADGERTHCIDCTTRPTRNPSTE